jgi:hypothetical protein
MSACGPGTIVGYDGERKLGRRTNCGAPDCPNCGKRARAIYRAKIRAGRPNRFINPTIIHLPDRTREQELKLLATAFHKFVVWWKRDHPNWEFEYFEVRECKGERHVHLHIAARCGFIPHNVFRDFMERETGSYIQDIRAIKSVRQLEVYLTNYVTKDMRRIGAMHRYSKSHNYEPEKGERAPDPFLFGLRYYFEPTLLEDKAKEWEIRGLTVKWTSKHEVRATGPP